MDHPTFKLNMAADDIVFIVNHTRRDYIHANKIIDVDDDGLVVQWYLQDATLTIARRDKCYRVIAVGPTMTKEEWEAVEQVDTQSYRDKHYGGASLEEVASYVKANRKKAG